MSDGGTAAEAQTPTDQEVRARIATVNVGVWLTLIVATGALIAVLLSFEGPNRVPALIVVGLGLLSAPLIWMLPIERIVRSRHRDLFFFAWSGADIAFIAAIAALDGGVESPYAWMLVLPILFAALTYPLRLTILVGAVNIAAFALVAAAVGGGLVLSGLGSFTLFCAALLGAWEARNQAARRIELSRSAEALRASEETSRMRARQQREVASYGQLALGGAETDALLDEATRLIQRVLAADFSVALKLLPGGRELLIVSGTGLPEEAIGKARVPTGYRSQSGYALATGTPTVVEDWETETRFEQSEIQRQLGTRSGVTVLIKAKGHPFGILGAASTSPGRFRPEDVSFLQAIANVLANAIERRTAEEQVRHEALHDPLTTLPNRNLFLDRLDHALVQSRRRESSIAVLFLDLDQFKLVNDSLGHAAGDELLSAVAPRIEQALRPEDTVARFGGDEFAILTEDVGNERDAIRVAERIAAALTKPFVLRHREHFVSASIGIALGTGVEEPGALIRDADSALYRAKERGRGGYEIFDEAMRSRVIDHVQTENDLRRALQRGELELYFQPIISMRDNSVAIMEALLRWNHPIRGLVPPAGFIPVAEESRLIIPIGRWVIEEACRRAAAWQELDPDGPPVGVAVNLSARQIADPRLVQSVDDALRITGLDPSTLRLELTETTLFEEADSPAESLNGLKELGVRLVLDDFGTGFSSLGYLKRLPLSGIKIDRAFVENLTVDPDDAAIVAAVTEMARALGLDVCAEGVETTEQLRAVQELGCSHVQGFYFSRPVPADQVPAVLQGVPAGA